MLFVVLGTVIRRKYVYDSCGFFGLFWKRTNSKEEEPTEPTHKYFCMPEGLTNTLSAWT